MREIKFRFWSGNKMYYMDKENVQIITECLSQQFLFDSGFKDYPSYDHVGIHNASFMQYTGLKDKNGREIFEGDIVQNPVITGVVTYNRWLDSYGMAYSGFAISNDRVYKNLDGSLEVIGNIYETAEKGQS